MTIWTVLTIAVFLNSTDPPKTFSAILVGSDCTDEIAADFAQHILPPGTKVVDFGYACNTIEEPTAPRDVPEDKPTPKHVPGRNEA